MDLGELGLELSKRHAETLDDLGYQINLQGIPFDPEAPLNVQVFTADIPLHLHTSTDELLFVVAGLLNVKFGAQRQQLGCFKRFVVIPTNTPHAYSLVDGPVVVLSYKPTGINDDYVAL